MKYCINSHSPPSPLLADHSYKRDQVWVSDKSSAMRFLNRSININGFSLVVSFRTRALPAAASSFFLAAADAPPVGGKLSVLLQTSAVCIFAFWVANFVVPEFVLKDIQSRQEKEDGDNPSEDER